MNAKLWMVFLVIASLLCAPVALAQEEAAGTSDGSADAGTAPAESTADAGTTSDTATTTDASASTTDSAAAAETGSTDSTATDSGAAAGEVADAATTEATATETAAEETADAATNGNLEEALSDEMGAEETQAVEQEIAAEVQQVSYNLPGPFSRALAKIGDWATFDPEAKAARGLARAEQNKIRILQRMMSTGTGFARSPKWSAEMQKLQQDIEADMKMAEEAIAEAEGSSEQDLEEVSELSEALNEQAVLDATIAEAAQGTVEASQDLSSEELQTLNSVAGDLAETTEKVKGKAKKELLETAGKLAAKGKSLKDLKAVKDKAVKHKELRAKGKSEVKKAVEKKVEKKMDSSAGKVKSDTMKSSGPKAAGKSSGGKSSNGKGKNK